MTSVLFAASFPFKCDSCNQRFRYSALLQQHVVPAHAQELLTVKAELPLLANEDDSCVKVKAELPLLTNEDACCVKSEPADPDFDLPPVQDQCRPSQFSPTVCPHCGEILASDILLYEHRMLQHCMADKLRQPVVPAIKQEEDSSVSHSSTERVSTVVDGTVGGHDEQRSLECSLCEQQFPSWIALYGHISQRHPNADTRGRTDALPAPDAMSAPVAVAKRENSSSLVHDHDNGSVPVPPLQGAAQRGRHGHAAAKRGNSSSFFNDHAHGAAVSAAPLQDVGSRRGQSGQEFPCPECGMRFSSRRSLVIHKATHAAEDPRRPYRCADCTEAFASARGLRDHAASAHDEQSPYKCPQCPLKYKSKYSLRDHFGVHGPAKLRCRRCDERFHQPWELRVHTAARHAAEAKPHVCISCGRRFPVGRLMRKHWKEVHYDIDIFKQIKSNASLAQPVSGDEEAEL